MSATTSSTAAAAKKAAPAIPSRLVATTYRQLLRLALRLDLDPAFRSMVCVMHASVYSGELQCWRGIPRSKEASPIEQYSDDVLRFANLSSDFYIADPENSATAKQDWKVVKQLYPEHRFKVSAENDNNNNNNDDSTSTNNTNNNDDNNNITTTTSFKNYPLSYLTRLHFRGGPELAQFKKELHRVLEEAYMREIRDYNTTSDNNSTSSTTATSSASDSTTTNNHNNNNKTGKLGAIASAQPSAAQLGNALHFVRFLRNLSSVVRSDASTASTRVTSEEIYPDEAVLSGEETENDVEKRKELLGELELIPCYRAELRRRWKGHTGATATSEAIFSTRKQQADAAAALRRSASFKAPPVAEEENGEAAAAVTETTEDKKSAGAAAVGEKEPEPKAPKMDKAKVLQKLKERQAAKKLREEQEADEAASKPEQRWSPLFQFSSLSSNKSVGVVGLAEESSSNINAEEAKRSNLIHIDKAGAKWVDVPQKVTGNSASAFFLCAHPAMPGFFNGNILLIHQLDSEDGALGFTINRPLRNNDNVAVPVWAVFSQDTVSYAGTSGGEAAASSASSDAGSILHHLEDNRIFVGGPVSVAPAPVHRGPGSLSYGAGLVGGRGRGGFSSSSSSSAANPDPASSQREQAFLKVAHFLHRIPGVPHARLVAPNIWWGGDEGVIASKLASKEASPKDVMVMVGFAGWGSGQLEGEICSGSWITAVSKSPKDDKTYERTLKEMESTRPFASPRGEDDDNSDKSASSEQKEQTTTSASAENKEEEKSSSTPKLPTKFDTVADYVFAGNVPVSREERLFDYQKEPDPMPHQWKQYIRRLGAAGLTRMSVLQRDSDGWLPSSSSSSRSPSEGRK